MRKETNLTSCEMHWMPTYIRMHKYSPEQQQQQTHLVTYSQGFMHINKPLNFSYRNDSNVRQPRVIFLPYNLPRTFHTNISYGAERNHFAIKTYDICVGYKDSQFHNTLSLCLNLNATRIVKQHDLCDDCAI